MSKDNFLKLSRLLAHDPLWIDARPTHQAVFICILLRMAWSETQQMQNNHIVNIKPFQLYVAQRKLAEWTSKHITKDDVMGALRYFEKCKFLHQEVHHGKCLITVTHSDICEQIKNDDPPNLPPKFHQTSTTKEDNIDNIYTTTSTPPKKINEEEVFKFLNVYLTKKLPFSLSTVEKLCFLFNIQPVAKILIKFEDMKDTSWMKTPDLWLKSEVEKEANNQTIKKTIKEKNEKTIAYK